MLKITGVSKYKGSTYMIEFEEGETAFLNYEIVSAYGLRAGLDMPESAWEKIVFDNEFRKAKERALYLLDYRDYSYVELYKKLEKNYSEEICDAVMDKMLELGTVNDRRYAQGLAQRRYKPQGRSTEGFPLSSRTRHLLCRLLWYWQSGR